MYNKITICLNSKIDESDSWQGLLKLDGQPRTKVKMKLRNGQKHIYGFLNKVWSPLDYEDNPGEYPPRIALVNQITRRNLPMFSITKFEYMGFCLPFQGIIRTDYATGEIFCELKFSKDFYEAGIKNKKDYASKWTNLEDLNQ